MLLFGGAMYVLQDPCHKIRCIYRSEIKSFKTSIIDYLFCYYIRLSLLFAGALMGFVAEKYAASIY